MKRQDADAMMKAYVRIQELGQRYGRTYETPCPRCRKGCVSCFEAGYSYTGPLEAALWAVVKAKDACTAAALEPVPVNVWEDLHNELYDAIDIARQALDDPTKGTPG